MAECPFCKERVGTNDFLPSEEAACSACGQRPLAPPLSDPWWVSAPPLEPIKTNALLSNPTPEPWRSLPAAPEQKGPVVTQSAPPESIASPESNERVPVPIGKNPPLPPPLRIAASESRLPLRDESTDDDDPPSLRDRLRSIDLGSALAFVCFGVALLFRSFDELEAFIKPVAALGLLAGLLGGTLPALWRRSNVVLPLLLSILCLLVLLFAGSWPSSSSPPPPLVTISLKQKGMAAHQAVGEEDWVDASANAVKRGDARVEVVSAWIGPVELKRKSSTVASAERYLGIRLRVSYEGIVFQQTPYEPWAYLADSPSKHAPTLTDNRSRSYAQKTFDPGWKVVGRADVDALNPGHQVKEVLVYPVPERDVEYLRLTLPASAFSLAGAFRFQIPRSMIRGL